MTKELEEKANIEAQKFVENLEWHDTLDVQNAVRKAFLEGVKLRAEKSKPRRAAKKTKK